MTPSDYKTLRESIGTQEIVASLLGIARETLARRETGKATICTESELAIRFLAGGPAQAEAPEPEMSEIDRLRQEIAAIERNPDCYNNGGKGMTWEEHYQRFMPDYLDYLESALHEARQVLPVEMHQFEQQRGSLPSRSDSRHVEYLLLFQKHLGDDDVARFDRWDKEFNTGNTWKNPKELRTEARLSLDILRKRLARLEKSQA